MHAFKAKVHRRPSPGLFLLAALALFVLAGGAQARGLHHRRSPVLQISGTPAATAVVGQLYAFTPTTSAPRWRRLTFTISGKPSWASFDTASGTLTGTPTSSDVGTSANIVVSVHDRVSTASLAPFAITVSGGSTTTSSPPPNTPPTISGAPASSVTAGAAYTFTPTAADTDGDPLSFSIQNQPAWASFSPATGTLSGTPTAANVGSYSNIVISVSDGVTSASLAPFSVAVSSPSGSATVTWTAPTTYTDGTALTDLAGYHVYYGTSPSSLTQVIDVANAGATSDTISNLASATWYFAVTAYTTSGLESALSSVVSKAVQ